jgi:hypothetical protein
LCRFRQSQPALRGGQRRRRCQHLQSSPQQVPPTCPLTLNGKQNKIDRGDFEHLAGTIKIPQKVVGGIFERFRQGRALMVGELPQSRLSADMQEKVLRIMEERHRRLFGG